MGTAVISTVGAIVIGISDERVTGQAGVSQGFKEDWVVQS